MEKIEFNPFDPSGFENYRTLADKGKSAKMMKLLLGVTVLTVGVIVVYKIYVDNKERERI